MKLTPAVVAVRSSGLDHHVVEHEPAASAEESAQRRGIPLAHLVKTLVVRRAAEDLILVLVPGDRVIDWTLLRSHLGVSRLSLAGREEAAVATGYAPGTITPFGSATTLPVVADVAVGELAVASIGGGAKGVAINLAGADLVAYFDAEVAAVTKLP